MTCTRPVLGGLAAVLEGIGPVVVAFSGGADSALLAWAATSVLGAEQVLCATAVSPSLAPSELADCRALSAEWALRFVEVPTTELADPASAHYAEFGQFWTGMVGEVEQVLAEVMGT